MTEKNKSNKKWWILLFSIILTAMLFSIVMIIGAWQFSVVEVFNLYETTEPAYSSLRLSTTGPNYFFPLAKVSFSLTNPYAEEIKGFKFYMSFDNSSWVEIPLSNTTKYVELGKTSANTEEIKIFTTWSFPKQNNTSAPISNSFTFLLMIEPILTPQTSVIMVMLAIAMFSFILKILEFIFKN